MTIIDSINERKFIDFYEINGFIEQDLLKD